MRTLLFKIHNPSRETRVTLHRALRAYTNAAAAVLDGAAREWDQVRAEAEHHGALDTVRVQQALIRRYHRRTLPYPLHSSLRESLFADLAAQLRSYDALCRRWVAERERVRAHRGGRLGLGAPRSQGRGGPIRARRPSRVADHPARVPITITSTRPCPRSRPSTPSSTTSL